MVQETATSSSPADNSASHNGSGSVNGLVHPAPSAVDLIFPLQGQQIRGRKSLHARLQYLDQAIASGAIQSWSDTAFEEQPFLSSATFLYGPWRCNFSCPRYCYTKQMHTAMLSQETIRQLIAWAKARGAQFTYWPGVGEVTLFRDFWSLMEYHTTLQLPAIVFTNGSVFVDEHLCQSALGISCKTLLDRCATFPSLHWYVKVWSTNAEVGRNMTGTQAAAQYPYVTYKGMSCPQAFAALHSRFGNRIGMQCMVTQRNYNDFCENILPFCLKEQVPLFAEPLILSGNAHANPMVLAELLTGEQQQVLQSIFASGGEYCRRRQFGECIVIGNAFSPGIAIPPRPEDTLFDQHDTLRDPTSIYFNPYFREMREKSEQLGDCLCRARWQK